MVSPRHKIEIFSVSVRPRAKLLGALKCYDYLVFILETLNLPLFKFKCYQKCQKSAPRRSDRFSALKNIFLSASVSPKDKPIGVFKSYGLAGF